MKALRTCEACGVEFQAKRSDARICSNRCRQAAHRRRHPRQASERRCLACDRPIPPILQIWTGNKLEATCHTDWRLMPPHARPPGWDQWINEPGRRIEERPRRADAEYCSDACRQSAHRDRENQLDIGELAPVIAFLKDH